MASARAVPRTDDAVKVASYVDSHGACVLTGSGAPLDELAAAIFAGHARPLHATAPRASDVRRPARVEPGEVTADASGYEAGASEWIAGCGHQTLALQVFGMDRPDVVLLSCSTPTTAHFVVDMLDLLAGIDNALVGAMHRVVFTDDRKDTTPDGRETPGRWRGPVVSFARAKRRGATRAGGDDPSAAAVCVCRPPFADCGNDECARAIREAVVDASASAPRFMLRVGDVLVVDSNRVFHGMDPDGDGDARCWRMWAWTAHRPGDVPTGLCDALSDELLWTPVRRLPPAASLDDVDDGDEDEADVPGLAVLRGGGDSTRVKDSEAAAVYAAAGIAADVRVDVAAGLLEELEGEEVLANAEADADGVALLCGGVAVNGFANAPRLLEAVAGNEDLALLASKICGKDLVAWAHEAVAAGGEEQGEDKASCARAADGFAARRQARRQARGRGPGTAVALLDPPVAEVAQVLLLVLEARRLEEPVAVAFGCGAGELAALVVAGSVGEEDALRLAHARGCALACGGAGAGVVISGLEEGEIDALLEEANAFAAAAAGATLTDVADGAAVGVHAAAVAERLHAHACVIAGNADAVARVAADASNFGGVCRFCAYAPLPTARIGAFKDALARVAFVAPRRCAVVLPGGESPRTARAVPSALLTSLGRTADVACGLRAAKARARSVELGGGALTALLALL